MANEKQPTTIKKYANRRLYNTGTSAYVTLEDLAEMVKKGEDFQVFDAKTSDDITRSVLTQIIFEQEGKVGQAMLPVAFLRQLIRFYGDSMQALVPSYLEFTLDRLTSEQQKFRDQFTNVLGSGPLAEPTRQMFQAMDDFGAGHTSFRNLRRLPFDLIKMDGAFVQNIARSPDDRFFVRTLVDLAHHMNMPVVAEWVEDAETAKLLTEWGVEYMQGIHFADARIVENLGPVSEAAAA